MAQDAYGGPEQLSLRELPEPACAPRELRVAVQAVALNPSDWNIRDGRARLLVSQEFPLVLGSDVCGIVREVGSDVQGFAVGDTVVGATGRGGGLAEFVSIDASKVAKKPAALTDTEAAALPVVGQTAWRALFEELDLREGQRLLVVGGGGAVGRFAIELARARGIEVAATARPRSHDDLQKLSVSPVIDSGDADRYSAHGAFDAVLDTVGPAERLRAFAALRRGGRLVSIASIPTGRAGREQGSPGWACVLFDLLSAREHLRAKLGGSEYRYFFMNASGARMHEVLQCCAETGIRAPVDSVFALEDFADAFDRLENARLQGKVVVEVTR